MAKILVATDKPFAAIAVKGIREVNMERITGAKNDSFRIGDHVIPISRSYNRVAHEKYDEYLRFQQECNGEETE